MSPLALLILGLLFAVSISLVKIKPPDLQGYLTAEDKCYLKKLSMYVGKEDKVEKMITFYN